MNAKAKSLILKAQDSLDTAKKMLEEDQKHEHVGYNLAQAVECFLKALCEVRNLEYPHDEQQHDLDRLMEILEENNFSAVSSHADVVELTPYNSTSAEISSDERLDLEEYVEYVEDLRELVRDQAT